MLYSFPKFHTHDFICAQSLSRGQFFVTPWTGILPSSSVRGISQARYWSGLPFPPPGDLPNPGIEPASPALWTDSLPLSHGESPVISYNPVITPFSSTPVLPPASLSSLVMASLFFISVNLLLFFFYFTRLLYFLDSTCKWHPSMDSWLKNLKVTILQVLSYLLKNFAFKVLINTDFPFFPLAMLHGMWGLISLTGNQTCASCGGSLES